MTKPVIQSDLEHSIGACYRARGLKRRSLMAGLGSGFLILKISALQVWADDASPRDIIQPADSLIIRATPGLLSHVHDVAIPYTVLRAPPAQGVVLTSTKALYHTHEIPLSQKDLMAVNQGEAITIKRSSHRFVIAMV